MANTRIQVKRTSTSGRVANTSDVANSTYIAAGELALNMADGILYSSNGSVAIEIGANNTSVRITGGLTIDNAKQINFKTVNAAAASFLTQQNDDNFVFYSTNASYAARPVWGIYANSSTSNLQIYVPLQLNSTIIANGSPGTAGQILTSSATGIYWSAAAGGGTVTQVNTGNGLTGGPITTTGTVSVLANTGLIANSTGLFVNQTYVQNTDSRVLSGNLNFTGVNNYFSSATFSSTVNVNGLLTQNGVSTRVVDYASGTTLTLNCDTTDLANSFNTAVAGTLTLNPVSGTARDGQKLMLRLRCTNAQTLSWNTTVTGAFAGSVDLTLPTATTGSSKYDYFGFVYSTTAARWHLIAKNFGF